MTVEEALARLDEALAVLGGEPPEALSSSVTLLGLEAARTRLEAVVDRSAAAFEETKAYEVVGARSASGFLTFACRLPQGEAKAQLRRGRALRELPALAGAFAAGDVGAATADLVALALVDPATRDAVVEGEDLLVEQARSLSYASFKRALAYFCQLADPDGADARGEALRARRRFSLAQSFQGAFVGELCLDPLAGTIVAGELERLEKASFAADWAEAKDRLGRGPRSGELLRSAAQRRADALVEMARRSAACRDDAAFPAPLLSVLVDFPTLAGRICELANGTVVSPKSLLAHLDTAMIERAVWRGPARVEVGKTTRLFSGATRRAIELRDRVCQHPFCEAPAERCEVDHIVPFVEGGETVQANGRLACPFHNRLRVHGPEWPSKDDEGEGEDQGEDENGGGPAPP